MTNDHNWTRVSVGLLREMADKGIPEASRILLIYMRIRSGKTDRFFEDKRKTAITLGKANISERSQRNWFNKAAKPLQQAGFITKICRGQAGRNAEYLVHPDQPFHHHEFTQAEEHRFEEFWAQYPRREGEEGARRAFSALPGSDQSEALAAVSLYSFADDPQYVPHAKNWLRDRRWKDEQEASIRELVI